MLVHTDSILQSALVPHSLIAVALTSFCSAFPFLLMEISLILYLPLLAFFTFLAGEPFLQSGQGF